MSRIPNKIFADKGPQGGWLYREYEQIDTEHEFVRVAEVQRIIEKESKFFSQEGKLAATRISKLVEQI